MILVTIRFLREWVILWQKRMSFAQRVIDFHQQLRPDWDVPAGIDVLYPYAQAATMEALSTFYRTYYDDNEPRIGIFGINPGRFGAGVTGVPFTDPIRLETEVGIVNDFPKKPELSSEFVYEVVRAWGGPADFYRTFYITSLSPLGFTKDRRNYNYYDDRQLQAAVEPHIVENLRAQQAIGVRSCVALCLGQGKNGAYFTDLNARYGFFDDILILPHPRWVMQYRRRHVPEFVAMYLQQLRLALDRC